MSDIKQEFDPIDLYLQESFKLIRTFGIITFQILVYFFKLCPDCITIQTTMSSIPQGMFAAQKARENHERASTSNKVKISDLSPLKYNSKMMDSIWGLYNMYAPHNIKGLNDATTFNGDLQQSIVNLQKNIAVKELADGINKTKSVSQNSIPKLEALWSNIPVSQ